MSIYCESMKICIILFITTSMIFSQDLSIKKMSEEMTNFKLQGSVVGNIVGTKDLLYLSTESTIMSSNDEGENWNIVKSFGNDTSIVTLFIDSENWLWVSLSTIFEETSGNELPAGAGLVYREDGSEVWNYLNQPQDPKENFDTTKIVIPIATNVTNLSYSIEETIDPNDISSRRIWIASFAGSLRYIYADSLRLGLQPRWNLKTPNGKKLDVGNSDPFIGLGQRAFSLAANKNKLWVGTAVGVYYSDDFGNTFDHYPATSSTNTLSGNFITYLYNKGDSVYANSRVVYSGESNAFNFADFSNIQANDTNSIRADFSKLLDQEWIYSAFIDDEVQLLSGEKGYFFDYNNTSNFTNVLEINDQISDLKIVTTERYSVHSFKDDSDQRVILLGTGDGLAKTTDFGINWEVFKSSLITQNTIKKGSVIPSPSPFSPKHSINKVTFFFPQNSNGVSKLSIYNYAMELVYSKEQFLSSTERVKNIFWDGKDHSGHFVANGVYFIKVVTPADIYWNKLVILN